VTLKIYAKQEAIKLIKHVPFNIILSICLLVLAVSANAATLYVDVNGVDTNTGSSDKPFRTIQKGVDTAKPGDSVFVRKGTYYELVDIRNSGSSGHPITIEGELGTGGERLSIIDGSTSITGWVEAPEIGAGVYKKSSAAFEPGSIYVIEDSVPKDIPRCRDISIGETSKYSVGGQNDPTWVKYIAQGTHDTEPTDRRQVVVNVWDAIGGMFAYGDGTHGATNTIYLRFGDNSNPTTKTIRASQDGDAAVDISNKSYITIKNFKIRGAYRGINATGSSTNNIIIDNNEIYATGSDKIRVASSADSVEIKKNVMYMSGLGSYTPAAWDDGSRNGRATNAQGIKEHFYSVYKYKLSSGASSGDEDSGIVLESTGSLDITIHDNTIYNTLIGITASSAPSVDIYNNTIYNMSSIGILSGPGSNLTVHNNTIYDCNLTFRFASCENSPGSTSAHIYNNKLYNPDDIGELVYFHFGNGSASPTEWADFWFYHNSYSGGYRAITVDGNADELGGLKNTRFINNIFSPKNLFYGNNSVLYNDASMLELFSYNWVGGDYPYGKDPAWMDNTNIDAEYETIWDNSSLPDFILPLGSSCQKSGIDLSAEFTINGKTYRSLPGMEPGYYANDKPDMGVFYMDHRDLRSIPQNLRIALY
jgi:hypothetical protein